MASSVGSSRGGSGGSRSRRQRSSRTTSRRGGRRTADGAAGIAAPGPVCYFARFRMLGAGRRVAAIALNTYREAVRARILLGLSVLALATALYSIAVGEFALKHAPRVVADLGAASISIYAIGAAVIIGVTSLYRELEQKTIFPILARPIRRAEYIVGKYAGTLLTLAVFIALDAAAVLLILARHGGRGWPIIGVALALLVGVPILVAWRVPRAPTWLPIPLAAGAPR